MKILPSLKTCLSALIITGVPLLSVNAQTLDDEEVFSLDPFEVSAEHTNYIPQSSVVATGFAVENVKNPISIASLSDKFIVEDLKLDSLDDAASYLSGTSKRGGSLPGHGASFRVRGFETSWANRNGIRRYILNGTDNLDRLEIVKGPAAVFFGQAAPGGVVNYVTKRPSFTPLSSLELRYGSYDYKRVEVESQGPLFDSEKFAYRISSSYLDKKGWRNFEYQKRSYVYGGILYKPARNLKIYAEYERIKDEFNVGVSVPQGNPNWFNDYRALTDADNPVVDYYMANPQELQGLPLPASPSREAVIERLQGLWGRANSFGSNDRWRTYTARALGVDESSLPELVEIIPEATPYGWRWNSFGKAGFNKADLENISLEANWVVTDWLTLRGQAVWDNLFRPTWGNFQHKFNMSPEGAIFNATLAQRGEANESRTLSLDAVIQFDTGPLNNTLLLGATEFSDDFQQLAFDDLSTTPETNLAFWSYEANGYPDQSFGDSRIYIDGLIHYSVRTSTYANYVGRLWDERIVFMAGVREEEYVRYSNQGIENLRRKMATPSMGAVVELVEGINFFGSWSQSFSPYGGVSLYVLNSNLSSNERTQYRELLGSKMDAEEREGMGWDIGFKSNWKDDLISGTLSYYNVEENNLHATDDIEATLSEPLNQDYLAANPDAPASDLPVQRKRALGISRTAGIEADVVFQPNRNLSMIFSYTHVLKSEIEEEELGTKLEAPQSPKNRFSVWGKYSFSEGRLEGLSVGAGMVASSSLLTRPRTNNQNYVQDSYVTFDAMLSYNIDIREDQSLLLSLNIRNITDERYTLSLGTPEKNRQVLFSAKYAF